MPLRNASTTSPSSSIFSSFSGMTASLRGLDDVERLRPLLTLTGLELDLRSLGEGLESVSTDAGVMNEEILATVRRRDEAVALRVVEPLDGSCCHIEKHLLTTDHERVRVVLGTAGTRSR